MNQTERFYRIDQLLQNRRAVSIYKLMEQLSVSKNTIKRDIEKLRDRFNAPIIWDRSLHGYCFTEQSYDGPRYQLPGLWFNETEIHALLTFLQLLDKVQPGLLGKHIQPLKTRIYSLLEKSNYSISEVGRRIRLLSQASRQPAQECFGVVATAVLKRIRLDCTYYNRARDERTSRQLSPQRLVHYRDNWYLDAWCHRRKTLRTLALDAMLEVHLTEIQAKTLSEKSLDAELGSSYGIFSGQKTQIARLRFNAFRSRWVSREQWHPKQKTWMDNGELFLEIPYSDDRELSMDILKYGPDVEVVKPKSLRDRVESQLKEALNIYK